MTLLEKRKRKKIIIRLNTMIFKQFLMHLWKFLQVKGRTPYSPPPQLNFMWTFVNFCRLFFLKYFQRDLTTKDLSYYIYITCSIWKEVYVFCHLFFSQTICSYWIYKWHNHRIGVLKKLMKKKYFNIFRLSGGHNICGRGGLISYNFSIWPVKPGSASDNFISQDPKSENNGLP